MRFCRTEVGFSGCGAILAAITCLKDFDSSKAFAWSKAACCACFYTLNVFSSMILLTLSAG